MQKHLFASVISISMFLTACAQEADGNASSSDAYAAKVDAVTSKARFMDGAPQYPGSIVSEKTPQDIEKLGFDESGRRFTTKDTVAQVVEFYRNSFKAAKLGFLNTPNQNGVAQITNMDQAAVDAALAKNEAVSRLDIYVYDAGSETRIIYSAIFAD
jgi:PBP1b-binding outer membrane lipoprotein LpoB